jgi:hypothetical protein
MKRLNYRYLMTAPCQCGSEVSDMTITSRLLKVRLRNGIVERIDDANVHLE